MKQEIKDEAIEQLEMDIKMGFEFEEALFEGIREMFYDEADFDDDWLKNEIAIRFEQHQLDSQNWTYPTDFQRLAKAFDELIAQKIVCLHKAGMTKSDGESDGFEAIENLKKRGIEAIGFCYYHTQDLQRVVDPEDKSLFIGFDSFNQDDKLAVEIAQKLVDALKKNGLDTVWNGTVGQRVQVVNLNWQKIPDGENWDYGRVLQLLGSPEMPKKPFWKFW